MGNELADKYTNKATGKTFYDTQKKVVGGRNTSRNTMEKDIISRMSSMFLLAKHIDGRCTRCQVLETVKL